MFSMWSELSPRAPIPDRRIAQFMQPCMEVQSYLTEYALNAASIGLNGNL